MYNHINSGENNQAVVNELVIQNLIKIAGNPNLFQLLDCETQSELLDFIKIYTSENLNQIAELSGRREYKNWDSSMYAPMPAKIRK